ncbi:hypothetical protein DICVIV_13741, partial [Dictyocaulus viviparus]
ANCKRTCGYCKDSATASPLISSIPCGTHPRLCLCFFPFSVLPHYFTDTLTIIIDCLLNTSDIFSCSDWVQNNFCDSTFYSTAQKRQYCGRMCNLC